MGRQKGIITIGGTMDGLSFYKAYGKDLVRKSGGPSRKQIMTGKKFARTRENISEFGGCSKISKSFRTSIQHLKPLTDGQFGNRLTKLFKFVLDADEGVRGKRAIRLSTHREDFKDLEGNIKRQLSLNVPGSLSNTHEESRTRAQVTVQGWISDAVEPPEGASHFRFVHALGIVSDFIYNPRTKSYHAVNAKLDTKGHIEYSGYFSVDEGLPADYTSTVSLPITTPLPDTVSVVHVLGLTYFQRVATIYYPLDDSPALKVLEVF